MSIDYLKRSERGTECVCVHYVKARDRGTECVCV